MNQVIGLGISSIAKKKWKFEIPLRARACFDSSIILRYLGRAANGCFWWPVSRSRRHEGLGILSMRLYIQSSFSVSCKIYNYQVELTVRVSIAGSWIQCFSNHWWKVQPSTASKTVYQPKRWPHLNIWASKCCWIKYTFSRVSLDMQTSPSLCNVCFSVRRPRLLLTGKPQAHILNLQIVIIVRTPGWGDKRAFLILNTFKGIGLCCWLPPQSQRTLSS